MYGRGYYGGGYSDPSDLMQAYQGSVGYSPYSQKFMPGMAIQQIAQMFLMLKAMKEKKAQELGQQTWERGIEERKVGLDEQRIQAERDRWAAEDARDRAKQAQEEADRLSKEAQDLKEFRLKQKDYRLRKRKQVFSEKGGGKVAKPTVSDKKMAALDKLVEEGKITPETREFVRAGLTPPKPPEVPDIAKTSAQRQANETFLSKLRTDNPDNFTPEKIRKRREETKTRPMDESGYELDMPLRYNLSKKNISDGVATPDDNNVVAYYDKLYKDFIGQYLPKYKNFKTFIKSADAGIRGIDNNWIRTLFEIYGD